MDANQLLDLVKRYRENKGFITNEETAKMALVVPFLRHMGYDPNQPREVRLEYTAEFTQGDGKRLPDRMDFAIFDKNGSKPLMVIETKPLGTDLKSKTQQLARYIAQMPNLQFGIITDGCHYHFFGDLENPNQMDQDPFFSFALDDPKTDWEKVAKFLSKFSRDSFNAETLVTDAENSRYRQ
ncbi:MAG: type I restriction enzyme HsdR N-terminal domain-containing protein, partial [Planctomycetes bacterium]|nr:type I restriction enzyme HsdR N-terminal domain-containing protein [Planctomycetota bacterium]